MKPTPTDQAPASSSHSLRIWLPRIALLLAAGPLSTLAESGPTHEHEPPAFLKQADLDGDGALSVAEAGSLRGPIKDHFSEIDTDHDGRVTWAEIDAWMKTHPPARGRHDPGGASDDVASVPPADPPR